MLQLMGYDTGIDLPRLLTVARTLPQIVGHIVPGQLIKAGLVTDLHPSPTPGP
jgi:hydroxymethylglutaryl-CoA lyase